MQPSGLRGIAQEFAETYLEPLLVLHQAAQESRVRL